MTTWFSADWHVGHNNILAYCDRPFGDVDEMDEMLIDNWNLWVEPDDEAWFLGDFALGRSMEKIVDIIRRLNGHIFFVLGNHDERTIARKSSMFKGPGLFEEVYPGLVERKFNGTHVVMSHYALQVWNRYHRGAIMLHGHSHGTLHHSLTERKMDVGVDAVAHLLAAQRLTSDLRPEDYRPISLEEILTVLDGRTFEPLDHHGAARKEDR